MGIDEVGRGCLAGPVVVAGVIFDAPVWKDPPPWMDEINDSKAVPLKKREQLFGLIQKEARAFSIQFVSHERVDEINILRAMFEGARAVVNDLLRVQEQSIDLALVDGNQEIPRLSCAQRTVIGGDSVSRSIAAASILAKVTRDRWMKDAATRYPYYGFERNVGYGTKLHREALQKWGPCEIHRRSFLSQILSPDQSRVAVGKRMESLVADRLREQGFQVRFQNWRGPNSELDVVAVHENELHFFEVRSRARAIADMDQIFPAEKRQRFVHAVNEFRGRETAFRGLKPRLHFVEVANQQIEFYWDAFQL